MKFGYISKGGKIVIDGVIVGDVYRNSVPTDAIVVRCPSLGDGMVKVEYQGEYRWIEAPLLRGQSEPDPDRFANLPVWARAGYFYFMRVDPDEAWEIAHETAVLPQKRGGTDDYRGLR